MASKQGSVGKEKDVDSITAQMKELVKMNAMIQSKLASLENNLTEAKKKEAAEVEEDFELSEDAVEEILSQSSDDHTEKVPSSVNIDEEDDILELEKEEEELIASQLVDISIEEDDQDTINEKDGTSEEAKAPEDILDRESRELLESESFEDVKEDLVEEKKEIKEEDDVLLGHQMDKGEEEEEAKFNVEVKEEKVDPGELNMAPGWKVKFGKGRNSDRFPTSSSFCIRLPSQFWLTLSSSSTSSSQSA